MRLPIILTLVPVVLLGPGCSGDDASQASSGDPPPVAAPTRPSGPNWSPSENPKVAEFLEFEAPKPATWIGHPSTSSMRAANYTVPGRDGHDAAHIVVFYFGSDQGGSVNDNILRWQGQFRPDENGHPVQPIVERVEADGMPLTLVELEGEYMKMGANWYTPDQMLLAGILESPIGNVFIRLAGETATVKANKEDFLAMVKGIKRKK